jgi:hypothetical protein
LVNACHQEYQLSSFQNSLLFRKHFFVLTLHMYEKNLNGMLATKLTWKDDLEKSSARYHTYGAWIAIIFDPVFGITDYLNIPHAFLTNHGVAHRRCGGNGDCIVGLQE